MSVDQSVISSGNPVSSEEKGYTKTYNDKSWYLKAVLINTITKSINVLLTENIVGLKINNSIENFTPDLTLEYKDIEFHITKYLKNFACLLRINRKITGP